MFQVVVPVDTSQGTAKSSIWFKKWIVNMDAHLLTMIEICLLILARVLLALRLPTADERTLLKTNIQQICLRSFGFC